MNKLNLSHDLPLLLAILTLMFLIYLSVKPGTAKFLMWALLVVSILLILFGCGLVRPVEKPCVTEKDVQRHDRKQMRAKVPVQQYWKERSDGYWVHYRKVGFKEQTAYAFQCKQTPEQLERFYDSIAKR